MRHSVFTALPIIVCGSAGLLLISGSLSVASVPDNIVSPSCLGAVSFPHTMHIEDLGITCAECHHETNATTLSMPHDDYFEDFWIDCKVCHRESGVASEPQRCSNCHHSTPAGIADESLSAKVVIHKSCWGCHESGTGVAASAACSSCHQGSSDCE